jgi:hypothetical protein
MELRTRRFTHGRFWAVGKPRRGPLNAPSVYDLAVGYFYPTISVVLTYRRWVWAFDPGGGGLHMFPLRRLQKGPGWSTMAYDGRRGAIEAARAAQRWGAQGFDVCAGRLAQTPDDIGDSDSSGGLGAVTLRHAL